MIRSDVWVEVLHFIFSFFVIASCFLFSLVCLTVDEKPSDEFQSFPSFQNGSGGLD